MDMASPVSHSCKQCSCQHGAGNAVDLGFRPPLERAGARCWLLAPASSVTTCSGSGAIKSVTPKSGAAQASPRGLFLQMLFSPGNSGDARGRHPESKLYLPYIRNLQNRGPVGTGKEPRMPTTVRSEAESPRVSRREELVTHSASQSFIHSFNKELFHIQLSRRGTELWLLPAQLSLPL